MHGAGDGGHRDHAVAVAGDVEVAALAVRGGVAALEVDVEAGLPVGLDLGLDAAGDLRRQAPRGDGLDLDAGRFVQTHLDAADRDVGLAGIGADGVLRSEAIADVHLRPGAVGSAEQLDLAAAGGDDCLLGFERRGGRRNRLRDRSDGRLGVLLPAAGREKGERGGQMEQGPRHVVPLYAAVPERAK